MIKATFVQKVVIKHPTDNTFLTLIRNLKDKSRPGDFDIPGGGLENGETYEEALKREVLEETALEIEEIHPILISTRYNEETDKYFLYVGFKATAKTTEVTIDPKEHFDYRWLTKDEFESQAPDHILTEQIRLAT